MDSLLATYASDDDDEQHRLLQSPLPSLPPAKTSIFASLPPPSLPSSRAHAIATEGHDELKSVSSTAVNPDGAGKRRLPVFKSSLPPPKRVSEVGLPPSAKETTAKGRAVALSPFANDTDQSERKKLRLFGCVPPLKSQLETGFSFADESTVRDKGDRLASSAAGSDQTEAKRTGLFSSLPPPKSHSGAGSSLFGSLPPAKNQGGPPEAKRVVEFRPPLNKAILEAPDYEDDNPSPKRRHASDFSPSKNAGGSGLVAILPPPKNTVLGAGAALGGGACGPGGRRMAFENTSAGEDTPSSETPNLQAVSGFSNSAISESSGLNFQENPNSGAAELASIRDSGQVFQHYGPTGFMVEATDMHQSQVTTAEVATEGYSGALLQTQGFYCHYPNPDSNANLQTQDPLANIMKFQKRRGKAAVPTFVEVKQDDLTNKKVREDQLKATGIAFGPTYQPVSSNKDKPSKFQRRKHQIGSLYYDMKQKEMELLERRAKGHLTKAETQGKYGW